VGGTVLPTLKSGGGVHVPLVPPKITPMCVCVCLVLLAATIPHLDLMIALVGALSSSALALVFPPLLELVTYWNEPLGYGRCQWRVGKDILIMLFGILGFVIGTLTTLINVVQAFTEPPEREPC